MSQEEKLEIDGAIQISNSEDPTPDAGTIQWTGTDFEGWDGTQWISLSSLTNLTDQDSNIYKVVQIGTQTWMAENLKTTKYANGNDIPDGTGIGNLALVNNPKFWFAYNDDLANVPIYGRMYTWYVVNDIQKLCPTGWHVPSEAEWTTLNSFLGTAAVAGGKMKITGISRWNTPNTGADNTSGFSGLPGGLRPIPGFPGAINVLAFFWSSTAFDADNGMHIRLLNSNDNSDIVGAPKKLGQSVRCLKD